MNNATNLFFRIQQKKKDRLQDEVDVANLFFEIHCNKNYVILKKHFARQQTQLVEIACYLGKAVNVLP